MLMRSKLFVPGTRTELFGKAAASAADALSFDLEDAVVPARKAEARMAVAGYLAGPRAHGKVMIVRVNAIDTEHFAADMASIIPAGGLNVVNLPMVEEIGAVQHAARLIAQLRPGSAPPVRLLINIETPKGLRQAHELAAAHPLVMGLQIGYADLLEPFGIDRKESASLSQIRLAVRLAAAEARVAAYDGAYADVQDLDGFRAECEAARRQGFAGKSCIHPSQIAAANAAFRPQPREVERSRRILRAASDAETTGTGAFMVDGQMIDKPFIESARAIVALADLHAAASRET